MFYAKFKVGDKVKYISWYKYKKPYDTAYGGITLGDILTIRLIDERKYRNGFYGFKEIESTHGDVERCFELVVPKDESIINVFEMED